MWGLREGGEAQSKRGGRSSVHSCQQVKQSSPWSRPWELQTLIWGGGREAQVPTRPDVLQHLLEASLLRTWIPFDDCQVKFAKSWGHFVPGRWMRKRRRPQLVHARGRRVVAAFPRGSSHPSQRPGRGSPRAAASPVAVTSRVPCG